MLPDASTGQGKPVQPQTGLVTLLFTDIVSSTALKQHWGDKAGAVLIQQQRAPVRQLLAACPGAEEIETAGDSFLLLFPKPSDAVSFALVLQSRLRSLSQGQPMPLTERIGIHLGEVVIETHETGHKPKDLYGIQIDTCSRVMSLAKGGQVLMSRGVFDSARQVLKGEDIEGVGQLEWLNHGLTCSRAWTSRLRSVKSGKCAKSTRLDHPPVRKKRSARCHRTRSRYWVGDRLWAKRCRIRDGSWKRSWVKAALVRCG
jgi:class 3 adenylate cyclase